MTDLLSAAEAVLVAHQLHRGGCLCGWSELGQSLPRHQVRMLVESGVLVPETRELLQAAVIFVASFYGMRWDASFRTLAEAVEQVYPGAVAITRKALGKESVAEESTADSLRRRLR